MAALIVLTAASSLGQSATPEPFTKQAMLRDIASKILAPGWQEVAGKCRELTNSIARLIEKPDARSLEEARRVWLQTSKAVSRLRSFQAGPITERDFVYTFYYWQTLPYRMQDVLNSPKPIDSAHLEELGAPTKGLFAVEYLLFEIAPDQTNAAANTALVLDGLAGPRAENYRACLSVLSGELANKATLLANDWNAPGATGASQKFASSGQDSVNLLVNQMAACIEDASERHLHFVLVLPNPISRQLYRIERSRSGSSLDGVLASLEGAEKLFSGNAGFGLKDAIKQINPALERRLAEQFTSAIAATRAISMPLEEAAVKDRAAIEAAYEKARALEITLKVDVVSALGVTLTFSSNDGD